VTEAEVVKAIHGVIPATTMDAVKRRTRVGMGRCQGGFCGYRVAEILARELGVPVTEITKNGPGSEVFVGETKGLLRAESQ
jgi:glycerol-3-phosphate dehydrogenase